MAFLRNSCSSRKKRSKDTTAALTCCLAFHVVDFNRFANKSWKYRCDEKAHENLWSSLLAICRMQIDFYLGLLAFFSYQQSGNASVWLSGFIVRNIFYDVCTIVGSETDFDLVLRGSSLVSSWQIWEMFFGFFWGTSLSSEKHLTHCLEMFVSFDLWWLISSTSPRPTSLKLAWNRSRLKHNLPHSCT